MLKRGSLFAAVWHMVALAAQLGQFHRRARRIPSLSLCARSERQCAPVLLGTQTFLASLSTATPRKKKAAQLAAFSAPGVGIEPTTSRLTVERICLIELP